MVNGYKNWQYHWASQRKAERQRAQSDAQRAALNRLRSDVQKKVFNTAIKSAKRRGPSKIKVADRLRKLCSFVAGTRCKVPSLSEKRLVEATLVAVRHCSSGMWLLVERCRVHQRHVRGACGRRAHYIAVQDAFIN